MRERVNIRNSYILHPKLPKTPIFLAKILLYSSYILGMTWLTAWIDDFRFLLNDTKLNGLCQNLQKGIWVTELSDE